MYIPKGKGALRPLGIPAVRCRVAQEVIRALMEPIFAPTFHDSSHGFRRHRSCHTAMAQLVELHQHGYRVVVDADLKGFFDSIPHQLILDLVAREMADGNILSLIKKCLQAGVMEEGEVRPTRQGTPQGGVVYTPYKVANLVLEFSTSIPRTQLRPGYGDGFLGAPLHVVPASQSPIAQKQGDRRGTSSLPTAPDAGGSHRI